MEIFPFSLWLLLKERIYFLSAMFFPLTVAPISDKKIKFKATFCLKKSCLPLLCKNVSKLSGPSCSKLTMSLVNNSLKFTSSDTQIF